MTSSEIQAEILSLTAKATTAKQKQADAQSSIDGSMVYYNGCDTNKGYFLETGKQKEKRISDCKSNWNEKMVPYRQALSTATTEYNNIQANLSQLQSQLAAAIEAENKASLTLAEKGQTLESVAIKAQGEAQARNTTAQAEGVALLQKTEVDNSNAKKAKNVQLIIILSVSAIVLTAVAIILIRKLKKRNQ